MGLEPEAEGKPERNTWVQSLQPWGWMILPRLNFKSSSEASGVVIFLKFDMQIVMSCKQPVLYFISDLTSAVGWVEY